jgi:hypothetical protein
VTTKQRRARSIAAATLALSIVACGNSPAIDPSETTVTVSGIVFEGASTPLPDVLIEVINGPLVGGVVRTGADGRFSMPGVPAGMISLRASKTNYSTATAGALVAPGSNAPFRFSLEPLNPVAVNITGRVTDGSGAGVSGASVRIEWPIIGSTITDATGGYSLALSVRPPDFGRPGAWWGPTTVFAEKAGHEREERYVTLAAQTPLEFRLYPTIRFVPGETIALAVAHDDPYCYELSRVYTEWAWPCRIVRLTPSQTGTLMLELERYDAAGELGLQALDGRDTWFCCDARQSGHVVAGTEVRVEVVLIERAGLPPMRSVPFRLKTSMLPE